MANVLVIIMGGGRGERLYPLTKPRSKPAVPFGGKYRLVDIPISNCLNSGYCDVFVLTQFQSASLNRHIARTYRFDLFSPGFVEILAAEQTEESQEWYKGTADAIRKHLHRFLDPPYDSYLILSGDHLYRMDYRDLVGYHERTGADMTLSIYPVSREVAGQFGILQMAPDGRITGFYEKPSDPAVLDGLRVSEETLAASGIQDSSRAYLGSMGVYVFRREALENVLAGTSELDFGREVIPKALPRLRVMGYLFNGYWEDIGAIGAFYDASLRLLGGAPPFRFYEGGWPIFTRQRYLPPSRLLDCRAVNSFIADGCTLERVEVQSSILGIRSLVKEGTQILRSVVMGRDSYESPGEIGSNCHIERAILDLNVRIGDRVEIRGAEDRPDEDGEGYAVRDGIVVVPKNSVIPSGVKI
ncbi:MAG: sugar phosphate nucleotidyltransferase [Nitrospinota bacterium]